MLKNIANNTSGRGKKKRGIDKVRLYLYKVFENFICIKNNKDE